MSSVAANNQIVFKFEFNSMSVDGYWTTETKEIELQKYQSVVIEGLHNSLKSLQKELENEKKEHEDTKRKLEEKDVELFELAGVTMMNHEKAMRMKEELKKAEEEMEKAKEEMKKLEKKLKDSEETIDIIIKDTTAPMVTQEEEEVEEEPMESVIYGSNWTNNAIGQIVPQRTVNGLTVFGPQPPSQPSEPAAELPLSIGDGQMFCHIRTSRYGPEAFYKRENGVYRLYTGYKMRPMNFYTQPTGIRCRK
uniref:DUF3421 domain-containing protein n=1 Tax=Caenorhabditis tropicalis TaxID=1561998 RepID=A0A1I7TU05_9PELO